jgi:hypothetical protein
MRGFECGVLRKIFGPNRDEVTGDYRRECNKTVLDLYPHEVPELFGNKITKNDVGGASSI